MSGGVRLGAFGWATQTVHGTNRRSKKRPFVVVMENNGAFAVIFGRSEPRPDQRFEIMSAHSAHRDHPDRVIVIARIGDGDHRRRSEATKLLVAFSMGSAVSPPASSSTGPSI